MAEAAELAGNTAEVVAVVAAVAAATGATGVLTPLPLPAAEIQHDETDASILLNIDASFASICCEVCMQCIFANQWSSRNGCA